MKKFDNEYLKSIIDLKKIDNDQFLITFTSGETETAMLTKTEQLVTQKYLDSLQEDERPTSDTVAANTASDNRYNSGIKPANIQEERKVGKKTWQEAALMHVTGKKPGYAYYFIDTEEPGAFNQALAEYWEPCTDEGIAMPDHTIQDGIGIGSSKQIRELILMRMSPEMKDARKAHYKSKQKSSQDLQRELESETNHSNYPGSGVYGHGITRY